MSRCSRTAAMEAVALGELSCPRADALRAHARECAVCRHELSWLEAEAQLFRRRAARDEVARLWEGVAARRGLGARRAPSRALAALAAALALLVGGGLAVRRAGAGASAGGQASPAAEGEVLVTEALMSPALWQSAPGEACSRLPSGVGFRCEAVVPASMLASR